MRAEVVVSGRIRKRLFDRVKLHTDVILSAAAWQCFDLHDHPAAKDLKSALGFDSRSPAVFPVRIIQPTSVDEVRFGGARAGRLKPRHRGNNGTKSAFADYWLQRSRRSVARYGLPFSRTCVNQLLRRL